MPRLFTGLEVPHHIATMLASLRGGLVGARWIDMENYHLTLRFMGDIDDWHARDVDAMLGYVRRKPFTLTIDGLQIFGGDRPRALVARVAPSQQLIELQAEHERLVRRAGLPPERRIELRIGIHIRDTSPWHAADFLAGLGHVPSQSYTANSFVLFSSRASTGGGPYVVEAEYPLG